MIPIPGVFQVSPVEDSQIRRKAGAHQNYVGTGPASVGEFDDVVLGLRHIAFGNNSPGRQGVVDQIRLVAKRPIDRAGGCPGRLTAAAPTVHGLEEQAVPTAKRPHGPEGRPKGRILVFPGPRINSIIVDREWFFQLGDGHPPGKKAAILHPLSPGHAHKEAVGVPGDLVGQIRGVLAAPVGHNGFAVEHRGAIRVDHPFYFAAV